MQQLRLFPIQIVHEYPADLGSADCTIMGTGEDGLSYVLKTTAERGGPYVPMSEWVCSNLAHLCGLAVPPFFVANRPDGTRAFASRWEAGLAGQETVSRVLTGQDSSAIHDVGYRLVQTYVFDIFVANPDRHAGNFMVRVGGPRGHSVLMTPDYSRALLANSWPLPPPTLPVSCNTEVLFGTVLQRFDDVGKFAAAHNAVSRLESMDGDAMDAILDGMPAEWDPNGHRDDLRSWWTNGRIQRTSAMKEMISNGSYPAIFSHKGHS